MNVAIYFHDLPGSLARRQEAAAEHRQYIIDRLAMIIAAGATYTDDERYILGGSYMIDVSCLADAYRFFNDDPFTKAGVRTNVFIQPWLKSIFDGKFNIPVDDQPLTAGSVL